MKKILLHNIQYNIGGPNTVLNNITNSYLNEKFDFVYISQRGGCGYNPLKALRFVWKYSKMISREHADCIYICGLQYVGFLMTLAAKLSNVKKIVLSVHGSDWDVPENTLRKKVLKYIIEPWEIRMADKVFTVCGAEQKTVKALRFAKKGANCGVIYNTMPAIDTSKFTPNKLHSLLDIPQDKTIVASVGRVVDRKGHQYIIEAIKKLKDRDFVFVIIGDGDYLSHYYQECSEEIKNKQLYLLGAQNNVAELLADADIFLLATLNENHSMALLEAVSMRCAALVTEVGGNTETIINNQSGIVIPTANSDKIVEGLQKLKDKKLREKYAEAAYAYCNECFSIKNTLGKLEHLFAQ